MNLVVSPARGGADGWAAIQQLVLDAVSSPLTRVMYARALDDFFGWWTGQGRPPFTRATVQAWRAALEAKGLAPASVNPKLSAVRKLAAEAAELLLAELRARLDRGELTTSYLAARSLFSQPHVWHLLRRRRRLTIDTADALMFAAGIAVEDLLAPPPVEPPPPPGRRTRNAGPRMHVHRAA